MKSKVEKFIKLKTFYDCRPSFKFVGLYYFPLFHRIHSICFHPEGVQLIVGACDKVLVYEPNEGTLIDTLTGHKDTVYAVSYAYDGKKFASGGADKCVIVWSNKLDGLLKYS